MKIKMDMEMEMKMKRIPRKCTITRRNMRKNLLKKQLHMCNLCNCIIDEDPFGTLDHIVPLFQGGGWDESNLQVLCEDCHMTKNRKEISLLQEVQSSRDKLARLTGNMSLRFIARRDYSIIKEVYHGKA